jgi:hypothetical protein
MMLSMVDFNARIARLVQGMDEAEDRWVRRGAVHSLDDLLRLLSVRHCRDCRTRNVRECPLAEAVAKSEWAADSQWCPKCWGWLRSQQRLEDASGTVKEVKEWADSGFTVLIHSTGRSYLVARCDCAAGAGQHRGLLCAPGEAADYRCWPERSADYVRARLRVAEICSKARGYPGIGDRSE